MYSNALDYTNMQWSPCMVIATDKVPYTDCQLGAWYNHRWYSKTLTVPSIVYNFGEVLCADGAIMIERWNI